MNGIKILNAVSRATRASIDNSNVELSLPATDSLLFALWRNVIDDVPLGDIAIGYTVYDEKKRTDFIKTFCSAWLKKTTIRCMAGERVDIDLECSSVFQCQSEGSIDTFKMLPRRVLCWADAWVEIANFPEIDIYSFEIVKEIGKEMILSIGLKRAVPQPKEEEDSIIYPPLPEVSSKDVLIRIGDTTLIEKGTLNANVIRTVCNP